MKKRTKLLLGICAVAFAGVGLFIYSLDSNPALFIKTALKSPVVYVPTELPQETSDLFIVKGDLEQSDAFIYVQGGPALKRNVDGRNPLLSFPNHQDLLRVHPVQTQMMNASVLNAGPPLTAEQGAFEHKLNADILDRTIKYFKEDGKRVHAICHSYGTLICHEYIRSMDNQADNIVLMGFPLDMDLRTFDVGRGEIIRWEDGTTPIKEDPFPDFPFKSLVKPGLDDLFANMFRLIEAHAKKRYTNELKTADMSNVIYVYGQFDEASGRPSQEELDFLAMKNVEIVRTFGGHRSMWSPQFMANLYERLSNGSPFKPSITPALAHALEVEDSLAAIDWYSKAKLSGEYDALAEEELNHLAYRTLESGDVRASIDLFQLNTTEFPESSNAFDSLGEAYVANGQVELAIASYETSVLLDSGNSQGKKAIERLKKMKTSSE